MNIQRNFFGQMIIFFEGNEIDKQIECLMSFEPRTEEESEMVQRALLDAIEDDKKGRMS